uniref:Mitochondrial fission process protein 1 n=1 Tax=Steinernema glaseri TaxID=37863 RepID=A0A1I7YP26_9BILA
MSGTVTRLIVTAGSRDQWDTYKKVLSGAFYKKASEIYAKAAPPVYIPFITGSYRWPAVTISLVTVPLIMASSHLRRISVVSEAYTPP